MRKKLYTRFPASRIKKIMQSDEDVGKIALPVPLLISKALELFLHDLCNRTHEITLKRGAKTMGSFHLKQCVHSFNVFDFLKEIVSKVPDVGCSNVGTEDRSYRKRKALDSEDNAIDEESKMTKTLSVNSGSGQGRGRGRGRGRVDHGSNKCEVDPHVSSYCHVKPEEAENDYSTSQLTSTTDTGFTIRNFDLNRDPVEDEVNTSFSTMLFTKQPSEMDHDVDDYDNDD
ncbi:hypothetical protein HPP92_012547 [Vanilla planifolia]|uniref:Transcription factor CBF/NF-Y/archaeal histone domain-containing protein n=1 Tax=Vanilla planifolia TaxID=51239 RepID=A0A835UZG7_VANPL|nr:hypothetical protein HPP92_012547 [Vanilla planifolia]